MDTKFGVKSLRALLAGGALALALATPSQAADVISAKLFELDGNTVPASTAAAPDDWNDIYQTNGLHNSGVPAFITDTAPTKVFTSGSKDLGDIGSWHWSAGPSPNKADIQHAYAAAYTDPSSHNRIIYFGADRAATNGTVATGFWFFKNQVCAKADGTFAGGSADANGNCTSVNPPAVKHADGDTLVAVNYNNGGAVGTIAVYVWNGGLVQQVNVPNTTPGLFCISGNTACAITNGSLINAPDTPPWTGNLKSGQFFEGGIDISSLVGSSCFSTFMAMSRSSTTTNAELKNFVIGNFPVCNYSVSKECTNVQYVSGSQIQYTFDGKLTNTGLGNVNDITIADKPVLDSLGFVDCSDTSKSLGTTVATLAPGSEACYSGKVVATAPITVSDTITATATFDGDATAGQRTQSATANPCPAPLITGALQVTNTCSVFEEVINGQVVLRVDYSGTVTNPNTFPVTGIQVSDDKSAAGTPTLSATTLAQGASATFSGSYYPTAIDPTIQTQANGACTMFKDTVNASGTSDGFGYVPVSSGPGPATCGVCPSGQCPSGNFCPLP